MSITTEPVQQVLEQTFPEAMDIQVASEGNHCSVRIVDSSFSGQRTVQRQQRVNACLKDFIASGAIHAIRIQALSPEE